MEELTMEKVVNYAKNYGFIFQGSEIYGGLSNTWDYGPLGTLLKENIRNAWKKRFIQESKYNYGLDAAILMNPNVWAKSLPHLLCTLPASRGEQTTPSSPATFALCA